MLDKDLKNIYFEGQEIKAVYFKEKKIFPISIIGNEKVYSGYWNVGTYLEIVKMTIKDNILHQSVCDMNGDEIWNSDYEFKENSTYDNPLVCIADSGIGGGPRADYKIYYDSNSKMWIWLWLNRAKRYICRTLDEAKQKVAENI